MFLNLDGGSGSTDIVERLVLERKRRTAKSIGFDAVDVDEAILQAAVVLFRDRQQQQQQQQQRHPQQQQQQQHHQQRSIISIDNNTNNNCHNKNITLEKLCINNCPVNPYLEYLIEAAMGMDLFSELELQGNIEDENENENENTTDENNSNNNNTNSSISNSCNTNNVFALDALGFRMRFSRRLRKLELINLPMTRDHAESLMYGIETNHSTGTGCRLDTLFLENVRFEDGDDNDNDDNNNNEEDDDAGEEEEEEEEDDDIGNDDDAGTVSNSPRQQQDAGTVVIQELCEGFPNNRTLKTIELQRCRLTDSQIALIFDTLSCHPTLTSLNLSENFCRKLGFEALDRMLTTSSPPPQQQQQQQQQQQSNGGISNNNNNKEKNGTTGGDHQQQHKHKQNHCRLESLDLSYQFINTSEETYGMTGSGEEEEQRIQLNILTRNCTTRDACYKIYPNLRKLVLCGNQIDDSDMKDLAFLIRHRFPRLEEIDLRFNDITTDGLQTFADYSDPNNDDNFFTTNNNNYNNNNNNTTSNKTNTTNNVRKTQHKDHFPPPSSRLRIIRLTNNPLVMTNQTSIILLKLLKIYPELQLIQSNLEWENGTSIAMDIQHLVDINRAGRVLLLAGSSGSTCCDTSDTTSSRKREGSNDEASPISSPSSSTAAAAAAAAATTMKSQQELSPEEGRRRKQQHTHQRRPIPLSAWPLVLARLTRKARYPHYIPKKNSMNGMFYLIRHGPIIVEQISSRGGKSSIHNNNNNKNKNGKTNNNEYQDRNDRRPKRKWGDPALGGYETLEDFLRCELGVKS